MAIDYLEQYPDKKVLVITVNALVKYKENEDHGAFLNKWYKKLPFKQLHYDERVLITNNYFSNIQRFSNRQDIGLIIIDEVHLFLNHETLRYKAFKNIHSQKVVFLTATPIKSSTDDLKKYVQMARSILQNEKVVSEDWIDMLKTTEDGELICSKFDMQYPATRCFKGILNHLE